MCLPGTIESVREQTEREGVSRRALLAGGGAAAVAAALPGVADARKRRGRGHGGHDGGPRFGKVTDLTHLFRAGFPVYTGDEPKRARSRTTPPTASTRRSGPSASTRAPTSTLPGTSSPTPLSCPT